MVAPANPTINTGSPGADLVWNIDYTDEFIGPDGPATNVSNTFKWLDMTEALHQVGRKGVDVNGNLISGSASFRRWAAHYGHIPGETDHTGILARIENNQLVMGGLFTNEPDPGSIEYPFNGETVQMHLHRFYTCFGVSSDRVFDNAANGGAGGHIVDPNGPDIYVEPNSFTEFRISFEENRTQAFRWSAYLLPRVPNESLSYDVDPANGVEIDFPEFDPSPSFLGHLQQKVIAGDGGQTPNGDVDVLGDTGIDPSVGFHTMGLLWLPDILVWYVDGVETQRDEVHIPQVPHYIVFSREMNTGAKEYFNEFQTSNNYAVGDYVHNGNATYQASAIVTPGAFNPAQWNAVTYIDPSDVGQAANKLVAVRPYIPRDTGIFPPAHVWLDRNNVNTDVTRIDYLRTWKKDSGFGVTPVSSGRRITFKPAINHGSAIEASVDNPQAGEYFQWLKIRPDTEIVFESGANSSRAIIRAVGDVPIERTDDISVNIGDQAYPEITGPETIDSGLVTFTWSPGGHTVDEYIFTAGSSPGEGDYLHTGETTATSADNTVTIPQDGSPVFARLRYRIAGVWVEFDRKYDGFSSFNIITPRAGEELSEEAFPVSWDPGSVASDQYRVLVGTSGDRQAYHDTDTINDYDTLIPGGILPVDGSNVLITVMYRVYGQPFSLLSSKTHTCIAPID